MFSILSIDSLSSGYGSVPIIKNVSFSVEKGQIVALVGRNGVGKTTLVKTIVGQIKTSGGKIEFKGEDVTQYDSLAISRRGIGYVPQGRGIFPQLSVEDNLCMGELVGGRHKPAHYERVFAWFPILKARRKQKGGTLSGGEQQMLAIGRVLVGNPEVLLLDEPSEGIQPSIVELIGNFIKQLNEQEGLTILLVEQNIDLVLSVSDYCLGSVNK